MALGRQFTLLGENGFTGWSKQARPGAEQQGQLLKGGPRSEASTHPKGFTPERREDAKAALDYPEPGNSFHAWAAETVARSTVPLDEMVRSPDVRPQVFHDPSILKRGAVGTYNPVEAKVSSAYDPTTLGGSPNQKLRGSNRTAQWSRPGIEHTIMHEMGHHDDALSKPGRQIPYRTPSQVGKAEAVADDFAAKHWVPDRRSKLSDAEVSTIRGGQANVGGFSQRFEKSYKVHRKVAVPEKKVREPYVERPGFDTHLARQIPLPDYSDINTKHDYYDKRDAITSEWSGRKTRDRMR